jgi:hypothetical protein
MTDPISRDKAERKVDSGDFADDEIAELSRVLGTIEFIRRDRDRRMNAARSTVEVLRASRDAGTSAPLYEDPDFPPHQAEGEAAP